MRRVLLLSAAALAGYAIAASAQGIKQSDVAGAWSGKSFVAPKDTVPYVLTVPAEGSGGTIKFAKGDAVPTRIITVGGDSVVFEAGPYPSILRPGETVKTLRIICHFNGSAMTGTFMARYASGQIVRGKSAATRQK
jgi:hypothetical protein